MKRAQTKSAHAWKAEHERLADSVRTLERRAYLTPSEQREMAELKKKKLLAKTELLRLGEE
ncbi:MAG: DUF465 domain-containing protein [Polyangiaceae bacterium]|nr:DUF465 domain-containing protein [Polyangiaceae bacterium]